MFKKNQEFLKYSNKEQQTSLEYCAYFPMPKVSEGRYNVQLFS